MSSETSRTQQVFRQRSPLWLAAVCAVIGLFLLLSLARSWADDPQPLFAAWVVFALAVVWSVFVRPAVLVDDDPQSSNNWSGQFGIEIEATTKVSVRNLWVKVLR